MGKCFGDDAGRLGHPLLQPEARDSQALCLFLRPSQPASQPAAVRPLWKCFGMIRGSPVIPKHLGPADGEMFWGEAGRLGNPKSFLAFGVENALGWSGAPWSSQNILWQPEARDSRPFAYF